MSSDYFSTSKQHDQSALNSSTGICLPLQTRVIKYDEGSYGGREQLLTLETIKLPSQHKDLGPI